jgi:two-component system chemotaxis response regulator CheY
MNMDMKILVADDMEAVRTSVCALLQHFGFTDIVEARDGCQAFDIIKSNKIDLLITDLDMPNMDGIELVRAIRSDDSLKALPVLFLTADAEKNSIAEAAQAGVDDYLLKPFTMKVLEQKIRKIFKD